MWLKKSEVWETGACVLVLAAATLAVFSPVVLEDQVPISMDSILSLPPWEDAEPDATLSKPSQEDRVAAERFYPWRVFQTTAASERESILWNPYEHGGSPFLAMWRTHALSPFSAPFYLLPPAPGLQVSVLLKVFAAGCCALYAARRLGLAPPFALLGALTFQLSGPMLLWANWPLSDTLVWLPLLLVFAERATFGQWACWPLGAITVGLMLLGGDPEGMAVALAFALVYVLLRQTMARAGLSQTVAPLLPLAGALVLGCGLAAVQLVPFLEWMRFAAPDGLTPDTAPPAVNALHVFFPHAFGNPTAGAGGGEAGFHYTGLFYVGIAQLTLLPVWFSVRRFVPALQRTRTEALLLVAALMSVLGLVLPPLLEGRPYLGGFNASHFLLANGLAVGLAGAAAADEWVLLDPDQCHRAVIRMLKAIPLFLMLAGAALAFGLWRMEGEAPALMKHIRWEGGILLGVLALLTVTVFHPSGRLLGYGSAFLGALALYGAFSPALPYSDEDALYPETPFIEALHRTGERVGGNEALRQWPLAGNRIPQTLGGEWMTLRRQTAFAERVNEDPLLLRRTGSGSLLLTKSEIQGAFMPVRPLLEIEHVFSSGAILFNDLQAPSRARVVYRVRPVTGFDPELLSSAEAPTAEYARPLPASRDSAPTPATITQEGHDRVVVDVPETPSPGILVLADTWYPGWRATVNGQPAAVFPVDGIFRGVVLPDEGPHRVVFRYAPRSFQAGLGLSGLAVLITLGGVFAMRRRKQA
ncbi:MAG: hypothetical protein ACLFV4_12465 [Candidatus Hydrogenedentota bacterium]